MGEGILNFYVDTNTFLHFQFFTEVNWCHELRVEQVVLVACPAVLHELDEKKFSDDAKVRERARKVISKLAELADRGQHAEIRKGVEILFVTKEPDVDWDAEGLSKDILDDRIIATILSEESTKDNPLLVTADLGLRLKAQSKNISCRSLPESLRLSQKKSPEEEELKRLRERLSRLENRLPALTLKLASEENEPGDFVRFPLKKVPPLAEADIEVKMAEIRKNYQQPPSSPAANPMLAFLSLGISQTEIDPYNKEVEEYLKQMPDYLRSKQAYDEFLARTITLRPCLVNGGNSPAEDIDIFMQFPDGFSLVDDERFPKPPPSPQKPTPPRTLIEMFQQMGAYPDLLGKIYIPSFRSHLRPPDSPKGPFIKKTSSYEVKFFVPKLKHGLMVELDPIHLIFPSFESAHPFHVDYSIIAANHPEEIKGKVHIIVTVKNP